MLLIINLLLLVVMEMISLMMNLLITSILNYFELIVMQMDILINLLFRKNILNHLNFHMN